MHRAVIGVTHPAMRRMIGELLRRAEGWEVDTDGYHPGRGLDAELVIVDAAGLPVAVHDGPTVIVVGAEPDAKYRDAAVRAGADGWVAPDRLAEELIPQIMHVMPCRNGADRHADEQWTDEKWGVTT